MFKFYSLFFISIVGVNFSFQAQEKKWMIGSFTRTENQKPLLSPDSLSLFSEPITNKIVSWESMATFNPAATVKNDTIFVIYRAEEKLGEKEIGGHTSRLGMAWSIDGKNFSKYPEPIFFPNNDLQKKYEWPGGTEDPRIVETEDGNYVLTYTQWNREYPRLAVATSANLRNWKKHGPIFEDWNDGKYNNQETRSGAIVTTLINGNLVAAKIDGKYWMYFGVPSIWLASSTDLINWEPLEDREGNLISVLQKRPGYFDSWLVEAGPPPILTEDGIVVLYNAGNDKIIGDVNLGDKIYTSGQALFDKDKPWKILDRSTEPFIKPEKDFEKSGQYKDGTTFVEGLVYFQNRFLLFYGTADSKVGMMTENRN